MYDQETIVPFPETLGRSPIVTDCRSTLLVASLGSIERRGHRPAYERNIGRTELEAISTLVAGVWLPIDLAVAHYRACDALRLTVQEQLDLGGEVVNKMHGTLMGTVLIAAKSAGAVTVWSVMTKLGQVFGRNFRGGGASVTRTGPKDARVDIVGLPLAAVPYFRVAYLGSIRAAIEFFSVRSVVTEIRESCTATTLGFRASWV
jgi:hypothetical protein